MIKTKHVELLNALSEMRESPVYAVRRPILERAEATIISQEQHLATLQAQIDELMFEYCPEEMTHEQIAEYERHQVSVE